MTFPTTSKDFEQFVAANKSGWPAELQASAEKASKALWRIDNNPPHQNQALEAMGSQAWKSDMNAIVAFAEAYGAWPAPPTSNYRIF